MARPWWTPCWLWFPALSGRISPLRRAAAISSSVTTGIRFNNVNGGTSIGIGSVMEFYINFGTTGIVVGFLVLGVLITSLDILATERLANQDLSGFILFYSARPGLSAGRRPAGRNYRFRSGRCHCCFARQPVPSSLPAQSAGTPFDSRHDADLDSWNSRTDADTSAASLMTFHPPRVDLLALFPSFDCRAFRRYSGHRTSGLGRNRQPQDDRQRLLLHQRRSQTSVRNARRPQPNHAEYDSRSGTAVC